MSSPQLKKSKNDSYAIYSDSLIHIFDKIKKCLKKRNPFYNEITAYLKTFPEQIERDKEDTLNADKYFPIIAKSLEDENREILDAYLVNIKALIKENMLLGYSNDVPIIQQEPNDLRKRKMIDSVIDTTIKQGTIKDEAVWFQLAELLFVIHINPMINLNEKSFEKIYKFLMKTYSRIANEKLGVQLEELIREMLINVFAIMQRYTALDKMKTPLEVYLSKLGRMMVDVVCIYSEAHKPANTTKVLVPANDEEFLLRDFRFLMKPCLLNDEGTQAGRFGWCFQCNKKADFYCKDKKKPICSVKCKELIEKDDDLLNKYCSGEYVPEDQLYLTSLKNCVSIMKYYCGLISKDNSNPKSKLLAMSLVALLFDKYGESIQNKREFITIAQIDLTEGILKNCVSDNISLFQSSINLFFLLWKHYRRYLKIHIELFNETVFCKIIASENSSYKLKKVILQFFSKLSSDYFIELYANYDCDVKEKFLVTRIITALSKIAQGKFLKAEILFSPQENYELRSLSLETLTNLLKRINELTSSLCSKRQPFLNDNSSEIIGGPSEESISIDDLSPLPDFSLTDISSNKQIDFNLKKKHEMQKAIEKFNLKIKNGLNYLKSIGYIRDKSKEQEAMDTMNFIKNTFGLKKEFIGDLLGDNSDVALLTLKYFAESFDFKEVHIVQALRTFLGAFHLPGEGQKIDRIIEKFALKYYHDNPALYSNADCAYYLSFVIILLQTELHNPNVKNKMTIDSFSQLLDGKNGSVNLSREYLTDIYEQIKCNPISLPELEEARDQFENRKEEKYRREAVRMLNECNEKLKQNKDSTSYIIIKEYEEYLIPLMNSIWMPLLAMYSVIIEESSDYDENELYPQCIGGLSKLIQVLGLLNLEQNKTVVFSLCKMTHILQIKPIAKKNVQCLKEIFTLASTDCRYMKTAWDSLIEIINRIVYYHLAIKGSKAERELIATAMKHKKKNHWDEQMEIEKDNMEVIAEKISQDDYEKIFSQTVRFDQDSLLTFLKTLCDSAKTQFKNDEVTKYFSLQKIVEVAELNLFRMRFLWSKIWHIISECLIEIGLSDNQYESQKAVNGLKQLATKYLQKKESSEYHFQIEFLQPFLVIWEKTHSSQTKEFIIDCLNYLVLSEGRIIKSGWTIILSIFGLSVSEANQVMINRSLQTIIDLSQSTPIFFEEMFPELLKCLGRFSDINPEKVIQFLDEANSKVTHQDNLYALLNCYTHFINDTRENIQQLGLTKLFTVISHTIDQDRFKLAHSPRFWSVLLDELLLKLIKDTSEKAYSKTLEQLLIKTGSLFTKHFDDNSSLFRGYLSTVEDIITGNIYKVDISQNGIECLKFLLGDARMSDPLFLHLFITLVASLLKKSLQIDFITLDIAHFSDPQYEAKYKEIIERNVLESGIHNKVIDIIDLLINKHINAIEAEDIDLLLDHLEMSFNLAYQFNFLIELRVLISMKFLKKSNKIASLCLQQQKATQLYYSVLASVYEVNYLHGGKRKEYTARIMVPAMKIITWFNEKSSVVFDEEREDDRMKAENDQLLNYMAASIQHSILPLLMRIEFYNGAEYREKGLKLILELILSEMVEIRDLVKAMLTQIYFHSKTASS